MSNLTAFFASRWGIISAGLFIGVLAPILQHLGNPPNMEICVACIERDIARALGLHRADVVQYLRPEIMGFVLGSLIAAMVFREFKPRTGSAPIIRFFLGFFAMVGALVFLGCPWRALLRLAGGDGNAILGLAGLAFGIWVGVLFLRSGYNLVWCPVNNYTFDVCSVFRRLGCVQPGLIVSSFSRARASLSTISPTVATQINGRGLSFQAVR